MLSILLSFFFSVVSLVASVFTLSLIALDRFYGIVFALKAHITERSAQKSLLFVWLCAVAVGSPILVYRNLYTTEWRDHVEKWCNDKWPNPGGANLQYPTIRRIYYTFVATVLYIIPMLVMTLAYSIVIWKLKSSAIPGETIEREVAMQARIKRKVNTHRSFPFFLSFSFSFAFLFFLFLFFPFVLFLSFFFVSFSFPFLFSFFLSFFFLVFLFLLLSFFFSFFLLCSRIPFFFTFSSFFSPFLFLLYLFLTFSSSFLFLCSLFIFIFSYMFFFSFVFPFLIFSSQNFCVIF